MPVPAEVSTRFAYEAPYVSKMADMVRDIVLSYCNENGFAYQGRKKDLASLWEKLETGRFKNWDQLDDLFACAIIIPTVAVEPEVLSFLESTFPNVVLKKRGATLKDPATFRFDATRYYGRLSPAQVPDDNSRLRQIAFEVQIRTAFEHAWSVTTHALSYKGDTVDWKKLRLAAQLKASVEQLDGLVATYEQTAADVQEHDWPEISSKRSIEKFFKDLIEAKTVPPESEPRSWVRFCDTFYSLVVSSQGQHLRSKDQVKRVDSALAELNKQFLAKDFVAPRSLSLIQVCLGLLTTHGFLKAPIAKYTPPLSSELLSLFPAVAVLGPGFEAASDL